jgi:hypothetical protein
MEPCSQTKTPAERQSVDQAKLRKMVLDRKQPATAPATKRQKAAPATKGQKAAKGKPTKTANKKRSLQANDVRASACHCCCLDALLKLGPSL